MQRQSSEWICVSDFDGTISKVDVTDQLLNAYADAEWLEVERDWKEGRIGSRACLAQQVKLLRATREDIDQLAASIEIDPHFAAFAQFCRKNGVKLAIVSDGLNCLINPILERYGLTNIPVFSNALLQVGTDQWMLASPYMDNTCSAEAGTCKCAVIDFLQCDFGEARVLYVGDGRSDFCAAARASDVVAAKSSLAAHLKQFGRSFAPYSNFEDVRLLLAGLLRTSNVVNLPRSAVNHELH